MYAEVVVAPPSCYLNYVRENLPNAVGVSAQNCYKAEKGAFTGEIRYGYIRVLVSHIYQLINVIWQCRLAPWV